MALGDGATPCRNCGWPAGPRFCGRCGQEIEPRRGPILGVAREVLSDWLSLDGRLVQTLAAMAVPGRLTKRYLAGKRAPYLRLFRLYLLSSILLFGSVLSLPTPDAREFNLRLSGHQVVTAPDNNAAEQADDEAAADARDEPAAAAAGEEVPGEGGLRFSLATGPESDSLPGWFPPEQIDKLRALPPQIVVNAFFDGLRRALPIFMILFAPILAGGLKVLYLPKKILYVDHLVFALHFQSALFLILVGAWLLGSPFGLSWDARFAVYAVAFAATFAVYLPFALRRVYPQAWWWTALKTLVLAVIYLFLLLHFVLRGVIMFVFVDLSRL